MPRDSLTPKQEAFCRAYVETGNASEAYRRSYSTKDMTPNVIAVEACVLLKHPKVSIRVAELLERNRTLSDVKDLTSMEERVARYRELAQKAEGMDDIQSAIRAEDSITRITGWFAKERENDRMPLGDALSMILERRKDAEKAEGTVH